MAVTSLWQRASGRVQCRYCIIDLVLTICYNDLRVLPLLSLAAVTGPVGDE
jgi:hypothetical protein